MTTMAKRQRTQHEQQSQTQTQTQASVETEALRTAICMRAMAARQAVSQGFATHTQLPSYMSDFELQQQTNALRRAPLPAGAAVPELVAMGSTRSTFDESWEARAALKRGLPADKDADQSLDAFISRHGPLSFDEDF